MDILGRPVSEKAAVAITQIESRLSKPVIYAFTDTTKTKSFGQSDAWQPDAYYVYSKAALFNITKANQVNIPFETNILHELSHLCQIEEGFPFTFTVQTPDTMQALDAYNAVGSSISSSVLDLNVDTRLKQLGYSSEYFHKHRVNTARKVARKQEEYRDPLQFVQMAAQLTAMTVLYPTPDTVDVLREFQLRNPGLIACVTTLSTGIQEIGYDTAERAFRCLVFLFSAFNLFATHGIVYGGKEYRSLSAVREDYSGIRIAHP